MKVAYIAPGYDVGSGDLHKVEMLMESAKMFGVKVQMYGSGNWPGFTVGKLNGVLEWINKHGAGYDLLVFTDGFDVLYSGGESDILEGYRDNGEPPILFSAEKTCWPDARMARYFPWCATPWKYPNAGTWMGQMESVKNSIEYMLKTYDFPNDDTLNWVSYYRDVMGQGFGIDRGCRVFQCMAGTIEEEVVMGDEKPWMNDVVDSWPVIWHFNGRSGNQIKAWNELKKLNENTRRLG